MNKEQITSVEFENIDHSDYPDYCDAFISYAELDGVAMTEAQLEKLNEDSDLVYELLMSHIH